MPRAVRDQLYRKVAWRLIPFLLACYTVAIIDRFNIGFAKLQFLQDLKMNDAIFGLAAGIFSIGYVALEVPSNLLLDRIGARKTLLRIMVLWGLVTVLLMFVHNQYHLYILRFLLGAAEGGFFPGILFYLTLWFPDRTRGRMTSLFVIAVPLGGVIAGPISGLILDGMQGVGGLRGWQWLFLAEGLPAVLLGFTAYFYLPDRPAGAGWLSSEEKRTIEQDLAADRAAALKTTKSFSAALQDPKVYLLSFIYFAFFCSLNTILLWAPSLLKRVGVVTATDIGYLSGIISIVSAVGMVAIGYSSDRLMERRWHVALCGFVASGCFLLLPLAAGSVAVTVMLLAVASIAIFSILSLFWTIPSGYLEGSAAAGGIALISAIGSFGGAVCPAFVGWVTVRTGSLYTALSAVALLGAVGMVTLILSVPSSRPSTDNSRGVIRPIAPAD
jgi:sugar phosphate permease